MSDHDTTPGAPETEAERQLARTLYWHWVGQRSSDYAAGPFDDHADYFTEMARSILASDWLATRDAAQRAAGAETALREAEFEIRDAKTIPIAARAAICAVLRARADRIGGAS